MAEPSASVASQIIGRMILVFLLVLGHCLTGCLGGPYSPPLFSKSLDSAGSLHVRLSENAVDLYRSTPSQDMQQEADAGLGDKSHRGGRDRELSLRKLLENLTKLRRRYGTESQHMILGAADLTDENIRTTRESLDQLLTNTLYPETHYDLQSEHSLNPLRDVQSPTPFQVITHLDLISSSYSDQTQNAIKRDQTYGRSGADSYLSSFDEPVTTQKSSVNKISKYFSHDNVEIMRRERQLQEQMDMDSHGVNQKSLHMFLDSGDEDINYVDYPQNQEHGFDNHDPSDLVQDFFLTQDKKHDRRQTDYSEDSLDEELNVVAVPHENINVVAGSDLIKDIPNYNEEQEGDVNTDKQPVSVDSLIYKTVKKMESIIKKRIAQYTDFFLVDSTQSSQESISFSQTSDRDTANNAESLRETDSVIPNTGSSDVDENEEDELLSHEQQHFEHVNDVTAAVIKAVASRTVPKDAQFWMNVSTYLDSSDYLSRTRRSPDRSRKRGRPQYVHLSITYGHVMPCEHKDRFYCMNGGTCVFVGALDIKTCR